MNQRTRQINFRVSYTEEQLLKQKCYDLGITISDFIRGSINDYVPNIKLNKEIARLSNEIRKIGVNINQIAKKANETGNINEIYFNNYKQELDSKIKEIDKFLKH
jgi:hypothetical protein